VTNPFIRFWILLRSIPSRIAGVFIGIRDYFSEKQVESTFGESLEKAFTSPADLVPHINSLRRHLTRAVLYLAVATGLSFLFFDEIFALLARPLEGGVSALRGIEITEGVGTVMRIALMTGFAVSFPLLVLEIWMFIAEGLSGRERRVGCTAIPAATLLFLGGMAFAYFALLPTAIPFLLNFMGITIEPRPSNYIGFVTSLMFWIGVAVEFPLVIYVLARLNWVQASTLARQWRLAVVVIAIASAFITPTVDPVNMSLVMFPMIILYFFSVALAWFAQRGKQPVKTVPKRKDRR